MSFMLFCVKYDSMTSLFLSPALCFISFLFESDLTLSLISFSSIHNFSSV